MLLRTRKTRMGCREAGIQTCGASAAGHPRKLTRGLEETNTGLDFAGLHMEVYFTFKMLLDQLTQPNLSGILYGQYIGGVMYTAMTPLGDGWD